MVWPLVMLAAQMLAKQQQEQEARQQEAVSLEKQRAARLGAPSTANVDEAQFENKLRNTSYASPKELMSIYGAGSSLFGGDDSAPTDGATSTTPGSDGLLNPWGPTGGTGKASDVIDPWDDDPYSLKKGL